jgi:glycosyltransferase involved in cell wall biosynthesis
MRGLRILHVIPGVAARQGGPAYSVVNSAVALNANGCECSILATDLLRPAAASSQSRACLKDLPNDASTLDLRLYRAVFPRRFAYSGQLARAIFKELGRYDVVHIHGLYLFPQLAAFVAARRRQVPYVVSPHGILDSVVRARSKRLKQLNDFVWSRRMLEHASALHCTSVREAKAAADLKLRSPFFVIPNGIDVGEFDGTGQADRFRNRFFPDFAGPVVLSLGRISQIKGMDVLIHAFAKLAREVTDARLAIAGPDDEGLIPLLSNMATDLGLANRVVFTGELRGRDRVDALAAASVWALPSRAENFGQAVVEAMAAGVPVVVSSEVSLAPEIDEEMAGLVVSRTPNAFASALMCLLNDGGLRASYGERARSLARRFDWSEVTPKLLGMYEAVGEHPALGSSYQRAAT